MLRVRALPHLSIQVCQFALGQYRAAGIHVHVNCSPAEVVTDEDDASGGATEGVRRRLRVRVQRQQGKAASGLGGKEAGGKEGAAAEEFWIDGCDEVVLTVGRGGKASGIGLEEAGVELGE